MCLVQAKEVYELETPAKLDKAQGYREAGVAAFKQSRTPRACKLWQRAVRPFPKPWLLCYACGGRC